MSDYISDTLILLASLFSLLGILSYCKNLNSINYPVFHVLYFIGISFWLSYGIETKEIFVVMSSLIQVVALFFTLVKKGFTHES